MQEKILTFGDCKECNKCDSATMRPANVVVKVPNG